MKEIYFSQIVEGSRTGRASWSESLSEYNKTGILSLKIEKTLLSLLKAMYISEHSKSYLLSLKQNDLSFIIDANKYLSIYSW